jgi:hypothetical protein
MMVVMMDAETTVELELSVSDCHSILSVLKMVIQEKKADEDMDADVMESLVLLYEAINQQLAETGGQSHAQGLYSTADDE